MISARKHGAAVRAFFALELPEPAREACAALAARLRRAPHGEGVRWVREDGYHVTLRFLGNVPREEVPTLTEAAAKAVAPLAPFEARLGAPHVLPSVRRPRVVALALEPEEALAELAARLDEAAVGAGLPPERRAFRAHLTLGRVRSRRVPPLEGAEVAAPPLPVREAVLFRSDLGPDGSRYTALARLPLEGARGAGAAPPREGSP